MTDAADKMTRKIIGQSMVAGEAITEETIGQIVGVMSRVGSFTKPWLAPVQRVLDRNIMRALVRQLTYTKVVSYLGGFAWAFEKLDEPQQVAVGVPPQFPPPGDLIELSDLPDGLRFPKIEAAAQTLLERTAITRPEFDRLEADAKAESFTVAGDIAEDTIEAIQETLTDNIKRGTSYGGFVEDLSPSLERSFLGPGHMETVYRTNVQSAFRDGRETMLNNPIVAEMFPYQEYVPIGDDRVREEHEALGSLGLDGTGVYRRDDPFWNHFTPPWGYNCFLPGNEVEGRIHSGMRSFYSGQAIKITTSSGNELTVTPNHPIYVEGDSGRDKIPASSISIGDYVLSDARETDLATGASPEKDKVNTPPTVEQKFRSLENMGGILRVPVTANDLHGDAKSGDGYIDVVGANRKLGDNRFTGFGSDCGGSFRLPWMDVRKLPKTIQRTLARFGVSNFGSGSSLPSGLALPDNFGTVSFDLLPLLGFRLGSIANFDPGMFQAVMDHAARTSEMLAYGLQRFASLVTANDFFAIDRDSWRSFSADRVVGLSRFHYDGPVYDFETVDGWQVVNGVKVSNCRCGINPLTKEAAARKGVKEAQRWVETGEPPSQPEYRWREIPFEPNPGWGTRGNVGTV